MQPARLDAGDPDGVPVSLGGEHRPRELAPAAEHLGIGVRVAVGRKDVRERREGRARWIANCVSASSGLARLITLSRSSRPCRTRRSPSTCRPSRRCRSASRGPHSRPSPRPRRHPLDHLVAALDERLRHALELAAEDRLEPGADLRAEVTRAHRQPEHLAVDLLDLVPGTSFMVVIGIVRAPPVPRDRRHARPSHVSPRPRRDPRPPCGSGSAHADAPRALELVVRAVADEHRTRAGSTPSSSQHSGRCAGRA